MCGIAGIISLKRNKPIRPEDVQDLSEMIKILEHRGPDQKGLCVGNDYAIGAARLEIIGGEAGKQPIRNLTNCLVFNGEIYNFKDLLASGSENSREDSSSDSRILFNFLNSHGINGLEKLNGMFSFCYITKDKIYLCRDRFGKKPLFYTIFDNSFYFASEIKAFINIVPIQLKITDMYRALETEVYSNTIYNNIFQIEPGQYIEIDKVSNKIRAIRYYSLRSQARSFSSLKQAKEELRWLLEDAVLIRSKVDKEIGVYTSGGIDSSIVASLSKPSYLFSFLPKNRLVPDEEKYFDILSSKISSSVVKVEDDNNFLKNFIKMVYANDGPTTTLASYAQYLLSKRVKNYNIRVMLSGLGADEFFNGYVRHAITYIPREGLNNLLFKDYGLLVKKAERDKGSKKDEVYYNLIKRSSENSPDLKRLIRNFFNKEKSILNAVSICDYFLTLPPLLLTDDHINMAFGIESRSPFLDYRIVEFALSLPDKMKVHFNKETNVLITKYILREAFREILPEAIYKRQEKVGFTSNVNEMLRGKMNDLVLRSLKLLQGSFPNQNYFFLGETFPEPHSRWEYQIVQIAIAYLLFTKKLSSEEVYEYYSSYLNK